MNESTNQPAPAQALMTLRLAWGATISGQVVLAVVAVVLADPTRRDVALANLFMYIAIAALAVLVPVGYFVRNQIYKAHWVEHAITPRGYLVGNIVLFALVEAVSIAALVGAIIANDAMRPLIVFGFALAVLAINFPTGAPMRPVKVEGGK